MNTKTTTSRLFYNIVLLTLLSTLANSPTFADTSEDQNDDDYGQMSMGMGYMGSGHMGSGYMGMNHMGMGYNFMSMLDLTNAQRKNIRNIHKATRVQQLNIADNIADLSDALYTLYKEDKPNAKKIGAIYKKIFDLKIQQIELSISTRNKAYDVLSKEQKEKLKEFKSSGMGARGYHGMQNMMR